MKPKGRERAIALEKCLCAQVCRTGVHSVIMPYNGQAPVCTVFIVKPKQGAGGVNEQLRGLRKAGLRAAL